MSGPPRTVSSTGGMMLMAPSAAHVLTTTTSTTTNSSSSSSTTPGGSSSSSKQCRHMLAQYSVRNLDEFCRELDRAFMAPMETPQLLHMSEKLQHQFRERLQSSSFSMLPSYNYTLPTGDEQGNYLALDMGGSTLRVAMVELAGLASHGSPTRITAMESFNIDDRIKALEGSAFFDWLADRIEETLVQKGHRYGHDVKALPMGLAWSFPVEQTSRKSGAVLGMGKGFFASQGVLGQDLGELIIQACRRKKLNVKMDAIVNDASATLLSRAYVDRSARLALVLGTGVNAAIHLPVSMLGSDKFGSRPRRWNDQPKHVLVNTELSMFGKDIFPITRWDVHLNSKNMLPDFQPFEQLVGGRYMGEIVRLILVEAVQTAGLFASGVPENIYKPYSLCTETMSVLDADRSSSLDVARARFATQHPSHAAVGHADLRFVQHVCRLVSKRAAALVATGLHALWRLGSSAAEGSSSASADRVSIGCNGSVIEKYPGFKAAVQQHIDTLTEMSGGTPHSVVLEPAVESAILGAAVAVGCLEAEGS